MCCAACCAVPRAMAMLGVKRPFLSELCDTVIRENGSAYPELVEHSDYIKKTISAEEERFSAPLTQASVFSTIWWRM